MNDQKPAAPAPAREPYFMDPMKYTVWAPIAWCLSRSFFIGIAAGVIPIFAGWGLTLIPLEVRWDIVMFAAALALFGGFLFTAARTFKGDQARAIGIMEKITNRDLNGDGTIGEKPKKQTYNQEPLQVWVGRHNGGQTYESNIQRIPHRQYLPMLAAGLLANREFAQRKWKTIPQDKFYEIQSAFVIAGLAAPRNGRDKTNGYELTEEGRKICGDIVTIARAEHQNPSPLPYFASQ